MNLRNITLALFLSISAMALAQVKNFNYNGQSITRLAIDGNAIDAHDGKIENFNGIYYLYGTSYGCGFEWGTEGAPFCGFKVYSSEDLVHWSDEGALFDATTETWQSRCNGNTYGCFRPHVIYNELTGLYILWVNVYDNRVGYRVFTSSHPAGPFKETTEPHLAVNSDMPAAELNNGDHDLFVDDDGTAYIAYTDWRSGGAIIVEKLKDDYLSGTGIYKRVTKSRTEAPALFKRHGIYYMLYSDPNCGYCSATGTSYKTASSPLESWSNAIKISDNSCGGQPSFVSTLMKGGDTVYLYGSDLWNNGAKNEALANYFWAPLSFDKSGEIEPIDCYIRYNMTEMNSMRINYKPEASSNKEYFKIDDLCNQMRRLQTFTVLESGKLEKLDLTLFKKGRPTDSLTIQIYKKSKDGLPEDSPLFTGYVEDGKLSWAPKKISIYPGISVNKNEKYVMTLYSASSNGCYGTIFRSSNVNLPEKEAFSNDNGETYTIEAGRELKFEKYIN